MLNLPRWQTIVIIAITVLSALFALPNLLPQSVLNALPHWYSQSRIGLGLDLRGGAHFLLEADLRSVLTERLTNLSDSVRAELRKQQIAFKDVNVEPGRAVRVSARLREGVRQNLAGERGRDEDEQPLGASLHHRRGRCQRRRRHGLLDLERARFRDVDVRSRDAFCHAPQAAPSRSVIARDDERPVVLAIRREERKSVERPRRGIARQ